MSNFKNNVRMIKRVIPNSDDQEFLYARQKDTIDSEGVYWRRDRIVCVSSPLNVTYSNTEFSGSITNADHLDSDTKNNNPIFSNLTDEQIKINFDNGRSKACFYRCDCIDVEFTSTIPDGVQWYFDIDTLTDTYGDKFDITYTNALTIKSADTYGDKTVYKSITFTMKNGIALTEDLLIVLAIKEYFKFSMTNTISKARIQSIQIPNILLNGEVRLYSTSIVEPYVALWLNDTFFTGLEVYYEGKIRINITASSVFSGISNRITENYVDEQSNENYVSYKSFVLNSATADVMNSSVSPDFLTVTPTPLQSSYSYSDRNYYLFLKNSGIESALVSTSTNYIDGDVEINLTCTGLYTSWIDNNLNYFEDYYAPIKFTMYQYETPIKTLTIGNNDGYYTEEDFMLITDTQYTNSSSAPSSSIENSIIVSYEDFYKSSNTFIEDVEIIEEEYNISFKCRYDTYLLTIFHKTDSYGKYSFSFQNCAQLLFSGIYFNTRFNLNASRKTYSLSLNKDNSGLPFGDYSDYYKWVDLNGSSLSSVIVEYGDKIIYMSDSHNNDGNMTDEIYTPISFDQNGVIIDDTQYDANYNFKIYKWYYQSSITSNEAKREEFNFKVSSYDSTTRLAKFKFIEYDYGSPLIVDDNTHNLGFRAEDFREAYKWQIPVNHYGITEVRLGLKNSSSLPNVETVSFGSKAFSNYITSGSPSTGLSNRILNFYGAENCSIWIKTKRISYTYDGITSLYYYYPPNQFYKEFVSYYAYNDLYMINDELWIRLVGSALNTAYGPNGKQIKSCVLVITSPKTTGTYTLNEPITLYVAKSGLHASVDERDEDGEPMYSSAHLEALISCENFLKYTGSSSSLYYANNIPNWRFYYRTNFDGKSYTHADGKYYEAYKWFLGDQEYPNYTGYGNPEAYFRNEDSTHTYISRNNDLYHFPTASRDLTGKFSSDRAFQQVEVAGLDISFAFAIGINSINSGAWTTDIALHDGSTSGTHIDYITTGASIGMRQISSLQSGSAFFGYVTDRTRNSQNTRYIYQGIEDEHYYRNDSEKEFLHFVLKKFKT